MRNRVVIIWQACMIMVSLSFVLPGFVSAQQSDDAWTVPLTPSGDPDLQGVWDFRTLTPLQRPDDRSEQAVLSAEEAAEIEAAAVQRAADADQPSEVRTEPLPAGGNVGAYNDFWFDRGANVVDDRRTSLIIDPPDGRVPALQPEIQTQGSPESETEIVSRPVRFRVGGIGTDGPEDRGLAERCLIGFNTGPPIVPAGYNQNLQLFQAPGVVAILNEMVHDVRIIPLDGRAHLPENVQQWMGDARGYWEGETLVVETKNFTGQTASFNPSVVTAMGSGETLHLTERFRRINDDTLLYEYTVNDSQTFTRPFTVALPMKRGAAPMYEYACHEGNYGLLNMLAGARAEEQELAP